ncbi:sodium-dependent transporter [Thermococcus sp.]
MKRLIALMTLLIVGYMVGVWTFLLFPQILIKNGLKGLALYLIVTAVLVVAPYFSVEATRRTRYLFVEYLTKISRFPGIAISLAIFAIIGGSLILYYSASVLAAAFAASDILYLVLILIVSLILASIILFHAKEKTLVLMTWFSAVFIIFVVISFFIIRDYSLTASGKSLSVQLALETLMTHITATNAPLTLRDGIRIVLLGFLGLGLGYGFFMVMGTFLPKEADSRKMIGAGYILQILIGILVTYIFVYALAATFPGTALRYAESGIADALKFAKDIIGALVAARSPEASRVLYLLVFSIYFAGMTTFIPLIETVGHVISESTQSSRNTALSIALSMVFFLSMILAVDTLRRMFLAAFFAYLPLMVALEMIPLIRNRNVLGQDARLYGSAIAVLGLLVAAVFIMKFVRGTVGQQLGVMVGVIFVLPVLLNGMLLKTRG